MRLITKLRPNKYVGKTKSDINSKANLYGWCSSGYGHSYMSPNVRENEFIYVVNYIKVRKKTEQKKQKNGKTKSTIIRNSHWIGYVYKIPMSWLKSEKKKVIQKTRNFIIVDSK